MSVTHVEQAWDLVSAARRLGGGDVLACEQWRVCLTDDGTGIWIERGASLWRIDRGKGCTARIRAVLEQQGLSEGMRA